MVQAIGNCKINAVILSPSPSEGLLVAADVACVGFVFFVSAFSASSLVLEEVFPPEVFFGALALPRARVSVEGQCGFTLRCAPGGSVLLYLTWCG